MKPIDKVRAEQRAETNRFVFVVGLIVSVGIAAAVAAWKIEGGL